MTRYLGVLGLLVGVVTGGLQAQDTTMTGPGVERLRQQIEDRFGERLSQELGLTDDQSVKVWGILASWAAKRRNLEREERQLRSQLTGAMRPGVAANDREVTRFVDEVLTTRAAMVQTYRGEMTELGSVLSPVQRAQYLLLRDRLLQRVQEVREQRQANGPFARRLRPR